MTQINTSELDTAIQDLGSSISNILNTALSANDVRMKSISSINFQAQGDSGIYGKGLAWVGDGPTRQFIYRANPDRIFSTESIDLDRSASYAIGNAIVLTSAELGPSIRTSSLTTVGTLNNLKTQGDLSIDEEIFYSSDSGRLGIGTDNPNGLLSIATFDGEFIIDSQVSGTKIGNWSNTDLEVITDDTTRITVRANGNVEVGNINNESTVFTVHGKIGIGVNNLSSDITFASAGPIKFENKKFQVGTNIPDNGTYRQGDIVWNENTVSTGYIGWVCVREGSPGEWKPFGQIG
jgi:hypothetical protein|tara:strand:- start:1138 stop:2016 length:879 start_codon:yes stop_codon:yes gene_type:complete